MNDPIKWAAENVDRAPAYASGSPAYAERPVGGYTVAEVYWALVRAGVEDLPAQDEPITGPGAKRLFTLAREHEGLT